MKCSLLFFVLAISWGGKENFGFGSGLGSKFNCAARVGPGQTISGTGRVRASIFQGPVVTKTVQMLLLLIVK